MVGQHELPRTDGQRGGRRETWTGYAVSQRARRPRLPDAGRWPERRGRLRRRHRGYAAPEQILGILEAWLAGPTDAQAVN